MNSKSIYDKWVLQGRIFRHAKAMALENKCKETEWLIASLANSKPFINHPRWRPVKKSPFPQFTPVIKY